MSSSSPFSAQYHPIPPSPTGATCTVHLLQAGGLTIPHELVFLPSPNTPNRTLEDPPPPLRSSEFYVPDYVFLISHSSGKYMFDLGMRVPLSDAPPATQKILSVFESSPVSPVDILTSHARPENQPENTKAVIFSHLHFDHIGDVGKAGFINAELWVGPTSCTHARPGYPTDPESSVFSSDFPTDGSRKIVEHFIPDQILEGVKDKRAGAVETAKKEGKYEGVELRDPKSGWFPIGAFERCCDIFNDGSVYLIDAPGHAPGHQMLLIRLKISRNTSTNSESSDDDFVLLAGDCFHHPSLLKDPLLTARAPYSKHSMHGDAEVAVDTIFRTREFAKRENVWVVGAHDPSVGEAIGGSGKGVVGLVELGEWRRNGWKGEQA